MRKSARIAAIFPVVALAWILWTQISGKKARPFQPEQSFKTKLSCDLMRDKLITSALKNKGVSFWTAGGIPGYKITSKNSTPDYVTLHCFPQDFDPRPRK